MNLLEQRLLQLDKRLTNAQLDQATIFRRFRYSLVEFEADLTRVHSETSSLVEAARMLLRETGNGLEEADGKKEKISGGEKNGLEEADGQKEEISGGEKNGVEEADGQKEEISGGEKNGVEEADGQKEEISGGEKNGVEEADGQKEEISGGEKNGLEEADGQKEEISGGAMEGQKEEEKTIGLEEADDQTKEFFGGEKNGLEEADGQKEEISDGAMEGQKEEEKTNALEEGDSKTKEFFDAAMDGQKEEEEKHELEEVDGKEEDISDGSMDEQKEEGTKNGLEDQQVAAVRAELSGIELVRSTLFRNIIVAYTGLSRDEREHLSAMVHKLGGQVWSAVDQKFTHLIADKCDPKSDKYNHARRSKLPVVLPLWINAAVKANDLETLNAALTKKFINAHKTPIFVECEISVSGFLGVERVELGRLVTMHGGSFNGQMSRASCTHLITATNSGQKYLRACEWGTVKVVSSRWLYESVEVGYRLPEDDFVFDKKEDDQLSSDSYVTTTGQQQSADRKHKKVTPAVKKNKMGPEP